MEFKNIFHKHYYNIKIFIIFAARNMEKGVESSTQLLTSLIFTPKKQNYFTYGKSRTTKTKSNDIDIDLLRQRHLYFFCK